MLALIKILVIRQYVTVIIVNASMINLGLNLVWGSPMLIKFRDPDQDILNRPPTVSEEAWIVAINPLAGLTSQLFTGTLMSNFGRKNTILISFVPRLIMCFLVLFASEVWMILLGRAIGGFGDLMCLSGVSTYVSEVAETKIRGASGSLTQIMSALGMMVMFSVGPYASYTVVNVVMIAIVVMTYLPILFIPESPYFLYSKGRTQDALEVLTLLRESEEKAHEEIKEYAAIPQAQSQSDVDKKSIFKDKVTIKSFVLVIVLSIGFNANGYSAVTYYLQSIFESAQTSISSEISSLIIGVIQLIAACSTFLTIDRFGRKPVLCISMIIMFIGMTKIRGASGSLTQIMSALGMMVMFSVGPYASYTVVNVVMIAIVVMTYLPILFIPESPYFLYSKGRTQDALEVLTLLRESEEKAHEEIKEYAAIPQAQSQSDVDKKSIFKDKVTIKSFVLVIVLSIGFNANGYSAVTYYLQSIFESAQTSISSEISSLIIGVIQLIAACSTFLTIDRFGRKPVLCISMIIMFIGMTKIRGASGSLTQIMSALGMMVMFSVGPYASYTVVNVVMIAIVVMTYLPILFIPESPYFLYSKGRTQDALEVLTLLRESEEKAHEEIKEYAAIPQAQSQSDVDKKSIFKDKVTIKSFVLVIVLSIGFNANGYSAVTYYLQSIFESAQTSISSEISSLIIGVIQLIAACSTFLTIDRFGRKPVLCISMIIMFIGMIGLGTFFVLFDNGYEITGFLNFLPLLTVAFIIYGFSAGLGSLLWIIMPELFEGALRPYGVTCGVIITGVGTFGLSLVFPPLLSSIGPAATYFIFSGFCLLIFFIIFFFVPETKGKTFVEIQVALGRKDVEIVKKYDKDEKVQNSNTVNVL